MLMRLQGNGNPLALLVGMQTGVATVENTMELPQKVKHRTIFFNVNCKLPLRVNNFVMCN